MAVEVVVVVLVPVADADQADVETLPRPLDIGQRLVGQLEADLGNVFDGVGMSEQDDVERFISTVQAEKSPS